MIRQLNLVFSLEMARVEELPSLCMYVSFLYQVSCVNQEPTAYTHCQDVHVNLEDMHGAP